MYEIFPKKLYFDNNLNKILMKFSEISQFFYDITIV